MYGSKHQCGSKKDEENAGGRAKRHTHMSCLGSLILRVCIFPEVYCQNYCNYSLEVFEGGDVGLVGDHQQLLVREEGLDALKQRHLPEVTEAAVHEIYYGDKERRAQPGALGQEQKLPGVSNPAPEKNMLVLPQQQRPHMMIAYFAGRR